GDSIAAAQHMVSVIECSIGKENFTGTLPDRRMKQYHMLTIEPYIFRQPMKNAWMGLDCVNSACIADTLRRNNREQADIRPAVHHDISPPQPSSQKLCICTEVIGLFPQNPSPYGRCE